MRPALLLALLLAASSARSEVAPAASHGRKALVSVGDAFRHAPGAPEAAGWLAEDFDDSSWAEAPSGFGYGDDDDATVLADMKGEHASLLLRRRFQATRADAESELVLVVRSDDGFVAWLNGREIARARVEGDPPAFGALAADHEASRAEEFRVPRGILREGANLLCIQAHNSHVDSSDFTIEPRLLVAAPPAPRPEASPAKPRTPVSRARARRTSFATTVAAFHASNFFQGVAGSPKESVFGQDLRQEIHFRTRGPLRLSLRAGMQRFGSLGTSPSIGGTATWSFDRHVASLGADASWNRPAFRLGDDLADGDSASVRASWLADVRKSLRFGLHAGAGRSRYELDPLRNSHVVHAGLSLRFLRENDAFSPELTVEGHRRTAGAPAYEYEEHRLILRIRSHPVDRLRLGAMLRAGFRNYAIDRSDRRRAVRLTADVELRDRLELVTFVSWEDGQSSLEARAFGGMMAWMGLRWRR